MLFFLLAKKWRAFFSFQKNLGVLLTQFSLLLVLLLYAFIAGYVYDLTVRNSLKISPKSILTAINYILLLFPVVFKFFPSVSLKPVLIQNYYPLTKLRQVLFELIFSIFSKTWIFFIVVFCAVFFTNSTFLTQGQLFVMLLSGICGILFAENLLNAFYERRKVYLLLMLGCLVVTLIIFQQITSIKYIYFIQFSVILLLLCAYYFFYQPGNLVVPSYIIDIFSSSKNILVKTYLRNEKYRSAALFSLLMQSVFIYLFVKYIAAELPVVKLYMLSSVFIFSYCFNNLWGFFPAMVINMYVAGRKMGDFIAVYLRILLPPLTINSICLIVIISLHQTIFSWKLLINISILTIFIIVNGLIFSFIKMKNITKAISFDSNNFNTNLIPTYIFGIISLVLYSVESNNLLFYIYIAFLLFYSIFGIVLLYKNQNYFTSILIKRMVKS